MYKEQRFQDIEKIMKECRILCEKKKIRTETYYVNHGSVQKGLVDQISKLGITSLVLGKSPQNSFTRALKKDIPTYVSKNAPKFCTVVVVCKGKLFSIKDAKQPHIQFSSTRSSNSAATDATASERSETSFGVDTEQDEPRTSGHIEDDDDDAADDYVDEDKVRAWHELKDDKSSNSGSYSLGFLESSSKVLLQNGLVNGAKNDSIASSTTRIHSSMDWTRSFNHEASKDIHEPWSSPDKNGQTAESPPGRNNLDDGTATTNNEPQECINAEPQGDIGSSPSSATSIYMTMDDSEIILYPNLDPLFQSSKDIEKPPNPRITMEPSVQTTSRAGEGVEASLKIELLENEAHVASDLDFLLNEAKVSARLARRQLEKQTNHLRKTAEVIAKIKRLTAERDAAVQEAKSAILKASIEKTKYEEAIAALKNQQLLQKKIEEEAQRNQETRTELEYLKKLVDNYSVEASMARQQAEEERYRYQETLLKLEEVTKKLETESHLRKEVEERASQEAIAKLEAVMALRKHERKYSEYTIRELQTATNGFHDDSKLGEGRYGSVYKGELYNSSVAIKVLASEGLGDDEFYKEVKLISQIYHPHIVALLGACPEKGCLVYEYMVNGSLEDCLNCKDGIPPLPWYVRFRICLEIATALLFLHSHPIPIIHRNLKPGNILFDHHFRSKIGDTGIAKLILNNVTMFRESTLAGTMAYIDPDYQRTGILSCETDVYSLGIIMLQLLTGKPAMGVTDLVEEAVENGRLEDVLDKSAGAWPLSEATALACLSMQCAEPRRRHRPNLETKVLPELERIQSAASTAATCAKLPFFNEKPLVPNFFICPISQAIMKNPHMAADGFTYEYEFIKLWLQQNDTSPMTNLTFNHKNLMPNHKLQSSIREWQESGLLP
ncbi:hypothetical protein KP509_10G049900 [Ceratopteris richardii]|nr:hypothetical protein KP509_10G049900 [Ceratopteris richardii]